MSNEINFHNIEEKWQRVWEESGSHHTDLDTNEKKLYCLTMFSYPSGDKLHIGHWYNYAPVDTYARFMKMRGFNVFQPQGFDSFGLPAENYAIKHGVHPAKSTAQNINKMREQLHHIGAMFDWRNEVNTSSLEYYKWTQWLFLKLYKMGLAYQKNAPVNWCPSCATVLANEQVKDGHCDRCDSQVSKRDLTQWFFKITDYAEELLSKLDGLDWPAKTKHMQRNWIGKSKGANIQFKIDNSAQMIQVFTTRPDTIFGATYMVLAPEHGLVSEITTKEQYNEVESYIENARKKTEIERAAADREKTGVFTGAYANHPLNDHKIPIWVGDYVLASYGSGAIMAVPSGDERDFEFAKQFDLPILEVVSPDGDLYGNDQCYTDYGISVNSGEYSGLSSEEASTRISEKLQKMNIGGPCIQFKLHDWLISRQRYWGAPIPIIHCNTCGTVPVPESELPVTLPENIELSATYGEDLSPLATSEDFMNTLCPNCGENALRDADTMDTFVCSSWYYLRYPNANYSDGPFDTSKLNWLPVDFYVGGAEHATMHLLYARFITKALRDGGVLNFDEPFTKLYHQGTITKDGAKMSKSKGNTVSPDEFIERYGSDTFRAYLMFMGPFDEGGDWNDKGITGIYRFFGKIVRLCSLIDTNCTTESSTEKLVHKTIKSVTHDLQEMKFNTAISRLMELVNEHSQVDVIDTFTVKTLILLLAPIAPHISEELWYLHIGGGKSVFDSPWPEFDPKLVIDDEVKIVIQVNGKVRWNMTISKDMPKADVLSAAKELDNVAKHIAEKEVVKEIYVTNKIVNLVVDH